MGTLISFFLGLAILMSGDEVGSLLGYGYVSLICNIVGVCFMAYGGKRYMDSRNELSQCQKDMQESLVHISGKMATASDIEAVADGLKMVCNNQMKTEKAFMDIISSIDAENSNFSAMVEKQIKEISFLKSELVSSNNERNKNLDAIHSEIVKMGKDLLEADKRNEEAVVSVKEVVEKASGAEIAKFENVVEAVGGLDRLPRALMENTDELSKKMDSYLSCVTKEMEYLVQDIGAQDKKRTADSKHMFQEIADSLEEYNEDVAEHIMGLAQQYVQFEKLAENLIRQITLMSEKDYEVMKGFLNG